MSSARWLGDQKTYRVVLILACVCLAILMIFPGVSLFLQDVHAQGRFPANVEICGTAVDFLTPRQAVAKCRRDLVGLAGQPLALKIDDETYQAAPGDIGLDLDYEKMVAEAYEGAWGVNVLERMTRRFLKRPKAIQSGVALKYDAAKLEDFLRRAMGTINRNPHDAYIDVASGEGHIVKAKDGRIIEFKDLQRQTQKALAAGSWQVPVQVKRTPAGKGDEGFGKYILVNLGSHTLSLYDRDTLIARYPVATGSKEWPTAIGQWAVTRADKNPTWYNRGSTWADNMPASLPPGPNNPLGTRAITINGGGVLIHGTSNTGSIGYSASHGCVRMYMKDVEALFGQVTIGMPVYIIKASGNPGFDCSRKPFWQ